ncbi:MAG TPA: hypothetical protein VMW28_06215, partial [Pelolinea sp.]|nr:hypothetical protein [Pelolinea sp.]
MGENLSKKSPKDWWLYFSLLVLSCATFLFIITLTRLFAIAHFYHFAFMVVSIALLGQGASGSFLSLFPVIRKENLYHASAVILMSCSVSILTSFLLINHLPFDAYAVAIDTQQIPIFILHLFSLAMPFFFTGLLINGLMNSLPGKSNLIYGFNLSGSALGCILAPIVLPALAGEGVVLICAASAAFIGLLSVLISLINRTRRNAYEVIILGITGLICTTIILPVLPEVLIRSQGKQGNPYFNLYLSPYKSLSYALQYPEAYIESTHWNAFSRVDVIRSNGIRSLPGLSYLYPGVVLAEAGLFTDGDNLSPVFPIDQGDGYLEYLPQSLAYQLRPSAAVLVLEPRGGLDLLAAQTGGASAITAVEPNPLLVQEAGEIYDLPNTITYIESPRSFLRSGEHQYDITIFSLSQTYHPITSGAYGLGEEYKYTLESIQDALDDLKPDGLLVLSRWLQVPPSEFLRAFILAVEALDRSGLESKLQIAAIRGYNLGTLYIKRSPFNEAELKQIRAFAEDRAFDLVYLPGITPKDSNRFNILPVDDYYNAFTGY